jgi:hypothetical protein
MVWFDDEEESSAREVNSWSAADAAEMCVDQNYDYDYDGIDKVTMHVKDSAGVITHWDVEIEFNPSFYATQVFLQ